MTIELILKNDYFLFTKFIGNISKKIVEFFHIEKPVCELFIRMIVSFFIFGSLGFVPPFMLGVITGDFLIISIDMALLFVWLMIGVFLIDIGEYIIDDFWIGFRKISKLKKNEFERLKNDSNNMFFSKKYSILFSFIIWPLACLAALNEWGNHSNPIMIMVFIQLFFAAILWGIGLWMTIYSYYFIWKICNTKIKIDPLAPDGLGGLSLISKLPIRASFLLSSLSLYIPYGIARKFHIGMGTQYWVINILSGSMFFIIIGIMIFAFIIPLIPIYKIAKTNKNNLLSSFDYQLNKMVKKYANKENLEKNMQILILFSRLDVIKKMRLWPINVEMTLKFLGYILLPTIFAIIGIYLRTA